MKNKDKDILPLGTDFEVLESGPAAAPAPAAPMAGPVPLRKAVSNGSIGLLIALAGLALPYAAPRFETIAALAMAVIIWQLASAGLGRIKPAATPLKPFGAALAIVAGALGFAFPEDGAGMLGSVFALLGGLLAIAAPSMGKKADAKLPPAPADAPVDNQFSKSFLAYMMVLVSLPLAWSNGAMGDDGLVGPVGTGMHNVVGALTFLCCVLGLWASWAGMWKMWSMSAVTSGLLGLVLFLAPMEAVLVGLLGVVRVVMGEDASGFFAAGWPAHGELDFLQYGLPPLLCLIGGAFAGFELFHGAKQGMEANKAKKAEEIAARKASRAARRESQGGAKAEDSKAGDAKGKADDAKGKADDAKGKADDVKSGSAAKADGKSAKK